MMTRLMNGVMRGLFKQSNSLFVVFGRAVKNKFVINRLFSTLENICYETSVNLISNPLQRFHLTSSNPESNLKENNEIIGSNDLGNEIDKLLCDVNKFPIKILRIRRGLMPPVKCYCLLILP